MIEFVIWSFGIVSVPLALGLACHLGAAVVHRITWDLRGPAARPGESGLHP